MLLKTFALALAAGVLAGCATQPSAPSAGKHLVYRDASGAALRQFDYPNDDFCQRVEKLAGRTARCQVQSLDAQMPARATLRYNPPGVLIEAHYQDMTRCQNETGQLGTGVQLVNACAAK